MSSDLKLVEDFFRAVTANQIRRASDVLAIDVTFDKNATPTQLGRGSTMRTIIAANEALIGTLTWQPAEAAGSIIRITGVTPEGAAKLGYIMTVTVRDGLITAIQQQDIRDARTTGAVRAGQQFDPIRIPAVIKTLPLGHVTRANRRLPQPMP